MLFLCSFMQPNRQHQALTCSEVDPETLLSVTTGALVIGSHFYSFDTLDRTCLGRLRTRQWADYVSNAEHKDAEIYFHHMIFYAAHHVKDIISYCHWVLGNEENPTAKSRFGPLQIMSLCWMCMSPEYFDTPNDKLSEEFLNQRHNAQITAVMVLQELFNQEGDVGMLFQSGWGQFVNEFNDRVVHSDDIISNGRRAVQLAMEFEDIFTPPPNSKMPRLIANLSDPRCKDILTDFYSTSEHPPTPHPNPKWNAKLPSTLFPWSNLAEGTIAFCPIPGAAWRLTGVTKVAINYYAVIAPLLGKRISDPNNPPNDPLVEWSYRSLHLVDNYMNEGLPKNKKDVDSWTYSLRGGTYPGHVGEGYPDQWIGLLERVEEGQEELESEDEEMADP